ncbi:MAG: alpha/beta hydrolase [Treponema sp.]
MSSPENRKAALKKLKLLIYNPKYDINIFRKKIDDAFHTPFLPGHAENNEHNYGGVLCDVLVPEIHSSKRIMLYIHGGCFTGGSRSSYRNFCAALANRAFSRVVVPEYRLAPAYPFPAALEDIQAVFRALFADEQAARSLDFRADEAAGLENLSEIDNQPEFIIGADGAGATIALALVLNLRERYRKCIKNIVLFSPWLNLSDSSPLKTGKKINDGIMSGECLKYSGDSYTYSGNLENPLVSPLFAPKELLTDFPPVYMQMGANEILLEDAKKFDKLLKENGVQCRLDIWKDMMHLFQLADEYLDEAHDALNVFSKLICGMEKDGTERLCFENKPRLERSLRAEA